MKASRFSPAGYHDRFTAAVIAAVVLAGLSAEAAVVVTPNHLSSSEGNSNLSTSNGAPLDHNLARTYQMQIDSSHLTSLGASASITGIAFRLDGGVAIDAPTTQINFTDYDIYLGEAVNDFGSVTTTFANNIANSTQVRNGALSLAIGAFESDGSPSPFGATIAFDTPYAYTGGVDLIIEIRHSTGTGPVSSLVIDADFVSVNGWGNAVGKTYVALGSGTGAAATTGSLTSFTPVSLTYTAVPEPFEYAVAAGLGLLAFAGWRRARGKGVAPVA